MIRAQAPGAQIALVTVFAGRKRTPDLYQIDQAIVAGAYAADPQVIIMDPLAEGWRFPRPRPDATRPCAPSPSRAQSPPIRAPNRPGRRPALDSPSLRPGLAART